MANSCKQKVYNARVSMSDCGRNGKMKICGKWYCQRHGADLAHKKLVGMMSLIRKLAIDGQNGSATHAMDVLRRIRERAENMLAAVGEPLEEPK